MALCRCASCGSKNVITDVQNGGIKYDYKKGIIGTVVLGAGGAVAGITNDTQTVYKCTDCGMTLTYCMPSEICAAIDKGLMSESARACLYTSYGQLSWNILKKQYKNIEAGLADREIAAREEKSTRNLMEMATASQEEFDNAVDILVDYDKRLGYSGSIYDELPANAFSDEMPMSYLEYSVWQDAIATFVENLAKYLPDPWPKRYRGLPTVWVKGYFISYLHEKVRVEFGRYPKYTGHKTCKDYSELAERYPFILGFADKYFEQRWTPFGTFDSQIIPWDAEKISEIERKFSGSVKSPTLVTVIFKFKNTLNSSDKEILVLRTYPRFYIEDSKIGFWSESNPHHRVADYEKMMETYFGNFPEEKKFFDEKIAEHKASLQGKNGLERKIEADKRSLESVKNTISSKSAEIEKLKKKIFGKKAALARITEIENEIGEDNKKIQSIEMAIKDAESKLKSIASDEEFYEQLVDDMNGFVAITWVTMQ